MQESVQRKWQLSLKTKKLSDAHQTSTQFQMYPSQAFKSFLLSLSDYEVHLLS